jgi:hypothetical protein
MRPWSGVAAARSPKCEVPRFRLVSRLAPCGRWVEMMMSVRQPVAVAGVSVPHATLVVVGRPTIVVTGAESGSSFSSSSL